MVTVAAEVECVFRAPDGSLADTLSVLGGKNMTFEGPEHAFETVGPDFGYCTIEFSTRICRSKQEVLESLRFMESRLPHGYTLEFRTSVPRGPDNRVPMAKKSRYPALIAAIQKEAPQGWERVFEVGAHCATQFHLGVRPLSREGTSLRNFLEHSAPHAAMCIRRRYAVRDAVGHGNIWKSFADPRRFPAPRWFRTPQELESYTRRIPRMIHEVDGEWQVDLKTPTILGDRDSEGTLWWDARARESYGTIELRVFPSLSFENTSELAGEVQSLANAFLEESGSKLYEEAYEAKSLFSALHRHFPDLVPARPFNAAAWQHLQAA